MRIPNQTSNKTSERAPSALDTVFFSLDLGLDREEVLNQFFYLRDLLPVWSTVLIDVLYERKSGSVYPRYFEIFHSSELSLSL